MQAVRMRPSDAVVTYTAHQDTLDSHTVAERFTSLEVVDKWNKAAIEAGGPEYTLAHGHPLFPDTLKGRIAKEAERLVVRQIWKRYGEQITLLGGDRGEGKTLLTVVICQLFQAYGFNVITNLGFDFGYRITGAGDLLGISRSPGYTIWVIDEAHSVLSKWQQNKKINRGIVGALAGARKQKAGVILITSQEEELGMDILKELQWAIYPIKREPVRDRRGRIVGFSAAETDWTHTRAIIVGPKPYRTGGGLREVYKIPTSRPKVHKEIWTPEVWEIEDASKRYGSWAEIPTREQSGENLDAKAVKEIDADSVIEFLDFSEAEGQDSQDTADVDLINRMLGDCYQAIIKGSLKGKVRVALLGSRVTLHTGNKYLVADLEGVLADYAGAEKGSVQVSDIKALFEQQEVADLAAD